MTTIEELERELEQFHRNIAGSNRLIEVINSVVESINAQKQDFSNRTDALLRLVESVPGEIDRNNTATITQLSQRITSSVEEQQKKIVEKSDSLAKLLESLPDIIEEKNNDSITELCRQIFEAVSKEHKSYINNIDQCVQALEAMKSGLATQQGAFFERISEATATFVQECEVHREAMGAIKTELLDKTVDTANNMTAENAKICANYIQLLRSVCAETKEEFYAYTVQVEQLTYQFAESEKKVSETIANTERIISNIIEESVGLHREIYNVMSQSNENLLLQIKIYIEQLEKQNEELVKSIEEKFNNSFNDMQNENAQIMEKLSRIETAQKRGMILTGIGLGVIAILLVLGFFI